MNGLIFKDGARVRALAGLYKDKEGAVRYYNPFTRNYQVVFRETVGGSIRTHYEYLPTKDIEEVKE